MDYLDVFWQLSGSHIRSKHSYSCWSGYTNVLTDLSVNNLHILGASSLCVWCCGWNLSACRHVLCQQATPSAHPPILFFFT